MREIDHKLDDALRAEESELLRQIGEGPGQVEQSLRLFTGATGWVHIVLAVVQAVFFFGGIWAAWRFFEAEDVLSALRWGLPAATLILMALIIKMGMWPSIHTNRIMLELKRIELQMARGGRG